jgi:hypothetical protein
VIDVVHIKELTHEKVTIVASILHTYIPILAQLEFNMYIDRKKNTLE